MPLAACLALACQNQPGGGDLQDASIPQPDASGDGPPLGCDLSGTPVDIDLLLVVGTSERSVATQEALLAGVPVILERLACELGARPNLHVGVVSTNMGAAGFAIPRCSGDGDGGRLLSEALIAGCDPPDDPYLRDVEVSGVRERNYRGDATDALRCIAALGTDGCSFEQPLAAAISATDDVLNPGFLRPSATLAIVVASGADDCSASSGNLFNPNASATLGPLSPFRCFEQGVICDPDEPRQIGGKTDCTSRDPSNFVTPVSELAVTLASRSDNLVLGYLGGFPGAIGVQNSSGQQSLVTACPGTLTSPAIRIGAFPDAAAGLLCSTSPAAVGPIVDAIVERVK